MSFHLSSGTLDSMAGIFSPNKKYQPGSGGGKGRAPKGGAAMLGVAVASIFPKANSNRGAYRLPAQTKQAFGGGNQAASSGRAIAIMERTARRVPEVMVRITGRQHGGGHVVANFAYISRLGQGPDKEVGLHTSDEEVIHDGREMQKLAHEWHEYEMGDDARRKGATSLSMILSMPAGTDPERMQAAALEFARDEFANRCWVAALHVDRDHPHIHLTIARRDHDGRRFHPNREDLFRYRQRFAEKLRDLGIEANATPAKARGIEPKHEHIAAQKVREKGLVPRLDKTRAARAGRYRTAGEPDPVDAVLARQRAVIRAAYEGSIAELSASPSLINKTVALSLQRFIDAMPEPEPNSIRAARTIDVERRVEGRAFASRRRADALAGPDALAAAIAKLRDATDRSKASYEASEGRGGRPDNGDRARQADMLDRSKTVLGEPDGQITADPGDKVAAVLHQVRERDRTHRDRDRDRSPDRDGSRR